MIFPTAWTVRTELKSLPRSVMMFEIVTGASVVAAKMKLSVDKTFSISISFWS